MTVYAFPETSLEAVETLRKYAGAARIIAGGTDLLLDMEQGKHAPACLVDITRIPELNVIEIGEDAVIVGAAVPFLALRQHPWLRRRVHALADAGASVGALPIQAAATWTGNLVQAMPAGDGAILAAALRAEVRVLDGAGERWISVSELCAGPGRSRIDSTRELVTHIRFPIPAGAWGTAWRRTGRRPSLVLPTLNCATSVVTEGDVIRSASIAIGPVGPCPVRAGGAEDFLAGRRTGPAVAAEAARLALRDANPRTSLLRGSREYRMAVLPVLVEEALTLAIERAQKSTESVYAPLAAVAATA